jgi:hypothetical protein
MRKFNDKALTHDRMGILTVESLSANQEFTPEGFLLCKNVPIARTGDQLYTADEIGLEARGDGLVKIQRDADEVFKETTISSFEGKPVTIDHPNGTDVNPSNWRDLTVGIVQNVRRGSGIEDDLLLADLLITDQRGIDSVKNGLKEVSCGYDADYQQIELGLGKQANIMGNHVALVERGRAGARCSIRDKEIVMSKPNSLLAKLRKFLDSEAEKMAEEEKATKDEDLEAEEGEMKTEDEDPNEARFAALEQGHAEIMKQLSAISAAMTEDEDPEMDPGEEKTMDEDLEEEKTEDSGDLTEAETAESNIDAGAKTFDSMKNVISRAEILAPGIKMPSGDSMKNSGVRENLMRKALGVALENPNVKDMVKPLLLGKQLGKLTGDSLKVAFNGASELIKVHNNAKGIRNSVSTKDFGGTMTPAAINQRNREYWKKK